VAAREIVARRSLSSHRITTRPAPGEATFAVAWAAGRALSLEDTVAFALEVCDPSSDEGE